MNHGQRRAWAALGIGPAWVLRAAADPARARVDAPVVPAEEAAAAIAPGSVILEGHAGVPSRLPAAANEAGGGPAGQGTSALAALREQAAVCQACKLWQGRTQVVFGTGDEQPQWMVIGEAPGAEEDRRGEPFVGQAGKLLDAMLAAVRLSRQHGVYIANVLKCHPPGNRNPAADEVAQCTPFLLRQIELLRPRLLLLAGRFAAQTLLQTDESIARLRGRVHRFRMGSLDLPAIVTYHPAYLLRDRLEDKQRCWQDLCLARATAAPDLPEAADGRA